MTHGMALWHDSFRKIMDGTKTVEMRLYDEKRRKISVGDTVMFTDKDTGDTAVCTVTGLFRYATFEELYAHHDKVSIGYGQDENADPKDMLAYYSEEKIERYGVLGIGVKRK